MDSKDVRPTAKPSTRSFSRPLQLELFATEGIGHPQPTPPYRRVASPSNPPLVSYPEQSPAYNSHSNLDLTANMDGHDRKLGSGREPDHDQKAAAKPAVHYPGDVYSPRPTLSRFDSGLETLSGSRTPSISGTDDETDEEDYDWSGEEDLVDQEARFEQTTGVKLKDRSWFKR